LNDGMFRTVTMKIDRMENIDKLFANIVKQLQEVYFQNKKALEENEKILKYIVIKD